MSHKIMVVDDDPEILELVSLFLSNDGYEIVSFSNGRDAINHIDDSYDVIILDINMPDLDGLSVCKRIRTRFKIPIIFLTAYSEDSDRVIGYSCGGDDFIAKPFGYTKLSIRVKSVLRRFCEYGAKPIDTNPEHLIHEDFELDCRNNCVMKRGEIVTLTEREYRILKLIMSHPGETLSIESIFERVWEEPFYYTCSNTVMVHIRNLRRKIEDDPQKPTFIINVWGKGYRFNAPKAI